MKLNISLWVVLLLPAIVLAQVISGSIDGVPLPSSTFDINEEALISSFVFRHHAEPSTEQDQQALAAARVKAICGRLKTAIVNAARNEQKRLLGISATDAELAQWQSRVKTVDPTTEWKFSHDRDVAITTALSQVYDQGKNPADVYQQIAKPAGIDADSWAQYLYLAKTKEGRQKLAAQLNMGPDAYQKAHAHANIRPLVENAKLDQAIDGILAQNDPKFRQILEASHPHYPVAGSLGGMDPGYLGQKRREWWMAQLSKMNVSLSDPSLYSSCQLSQMGIRQQ